MKRLAFALLVAIAFTAASPALAAGEEGMRLAQEAARAQNRGNLDLALTLYGQALGDVTLANDRRAGILSDRGVVYARLNQPKLAIDDYNRAVQLFPENAAVYNNRGNTLLALGLVKEAVKDFDRAILLAPGYAAAFNNRAAAYLLAKQGDDALRDYAKAISLNPQTAAPFYGRGRALLALDRPEAATRDFTRAINSDARFSQGYRSRAEAKLVLERYAEAIEDLSRAIAFEPSNIDLYNQRGHAYLAARNVAAAIKDFSKATEIDPNLSAAYAGRGLSYVKIDAFAEAETDLARALELDPRSAVAYAYRAWLYVRTDQPQLAQRELDKAARIEADRAEVIWAKATIDEALGRPTEAIESYRRAYAAKPTFREPAEALERLGLGAELAETVEIRGLGIDTWVVVRQGRRLLARSDAYPKISVPLEMAGKGQPRLLEWDVKKPPFKDIALLRFSAGRVTGPDGAEDVEQVAILDLAAGTIPGVIPHRQGSKYATWTWDEGKVTVVGVDGVTDELVLRQKREVVAVQRRPESTWGFPAWAPWNQDQGPRGDNRPRPHTKPKSIFDLIFGK